MQKFQQFWHIFKASPEMGQPASSVSSLVPILQVTSPFVRKSVEKPDEGNHTIVLKNIINQKSSEMDPQEKINF